jgi:hypothetical protein
VRRPTVREIKSPPALAALGAFFVPEPLGACLVIAAAIWWLCRKPFAHNRQPVVRAEFDGEYQKDSDGFAYETVAEAAAEPLGKSD